MERSGIIFWYSNDQFPYNYGGCRYGFNGKEKDDEVYGIGNLNTAMFWEYDTRFGRRWNRDPVADILPGCSPYVTLANNPIIFFDENGDVWNYFMGGIVGAGADYAAQVLLNRYSGMDWGSALTKVDRRSMALSAIQGFVTSGASAYTTITRKSLAFTAVSGAQYLKSNYDFNPKNGEKTAVPFSTAIARTAIGLGVGKLLGWGTTKLLTATSSKTLIIAETALRKASNRLVNNNTTRVGKLLKYEEALVEATTKLAKTKLLNSAVGKVAEIGPTKLMGQTINPPGTSAIQSVTGTASNLAENGVKHTYERVYVYNVQTEITKHGSDGSKVTFYNQKNEGKYTGAFIAK